MIDVAALITDYIDTCIPNWQDDKSAEIYNDHIKVIRFLADRNWEGYRVEYNPKICDPETTLKSKSRPGTT